MPIYQLPSETSINFSKGGDQFFIYLAGQVPYFIPLMLTSFFFILCLGGYFLQKRTEGRGDFPAWFAVAGFINAVLSIMLLMVDGLVPLSVTIISIIVAVIGMLWLITTE